jgi:hypothetical protein
MYMAHARAFSACGVATIGKITHPLAEKNNYEVLPKNRSTSVFPQMQR